MGKTVTHIIFQRSKFGQQMGTLPELEMTVLPSIAAHQGRIPPLRLAW